jgi:hypothetical protein
VAFNYISGEFIDYFRFRRNTRISVHGLHNISGNQGSIPNRLEKT